MLVLHALWNNQTTGHLYLWAESREKYAGNRQKPLPKKVFPHPFAVPPRELKEVLGLLSGSLFTVESGLGLLILQLPSDKEGPLPSPDLSVGSQGRRKAEGLTAWSLICHTFTPDLAFDFLIALPDHPPREIVFGPSLRYWLECAKFALELISRQAFLPSLRPAEDTLSYNEPQLTTGNRKKKTTTVTWRACWDPLLSDADEARFDLLARSMPPICRAFPLASVTQPFSPVSAVDNPAASAEIAPEPLLDDFLMLIIDAFVRGSLTTIPIIPEIPSPAARLKRRQPGKTKEAGEEMSTRWVQGLFSEDPYIEAPEEDLRHFAGTLDAWLQELRPAVDSPFRTCFRLEPPDYNDDEEATEGEEDQGETTEYGELRIELEGKVLDDKGVEEKTLDGKTLEGKTLEGKTLEGKWKLSYHLQAQDDRSLLVPAQEIWQARSSTATFLQRKFDNPQERLLADLGKASRFFPAIEKSLHATHPVAQELTTEEAYDFLRHVTPLLEQSGLGVLVPPWWQKQNTRLGLKMKLRTKEILKTEGESLLGADGLVSYDWNVAVGEKTLSAVEFEKLVNLKVPLVRIRGQWVELRPEEIERAISFFQNKAKQGEMSLPEALRLSLAQGGEIDAGLGLTVLDLEAEGALKELFDRLKGNISLSEVDQPEPLKGVLRPYQRKGLSWLSFMEQFGLGACLADDMGLGKSIQLISLLLQEREKSGVPLPGPTLLICPMSVVGNWQRELARFSPTLRVLVHHGNERLSGEKFAAEAARYDVVITTYALVYRDEAHLAAVGWQRIALDEAQNIKNRETKQTQAIRKLKSKFRVALTGTPVENRLSELWSIVDFLNPGYLGSARDFHQRFATPIEKYHNTDRAETLKRIIQPFVLRRLKTDKTIIEDLPDKMEMKVYCNLTREQATLYQAVLKDMLDQIAVEVGMKRRGIILAALMKLKQVCNHPAQFMKDGSTLENRSGKLTRLEEMLEEILATGDRALIFTQFAEMGTLLHDYLEDKFAREVLYLHGGTRKTQRDEMVQRFQETSGQREGGPSIFILSLKAGGVGLNLTGANHVFHFDRWWNPAVENQATDRAFRIGQLKNVQVHKFICAGTLEERIDQMIENKKALAENIVGAGENWLTELSTAQLKELFALSAEATGA